MRRRLPVAYDISRLALRVRNRTPNGIDRVDFALADHFVDPDVEGRSGMMITALGRDILTFLGLTYAMFAQDATLALLAIVIMPVAIVGVRKLGSRARKVA